mgnify:CR=1 FL=1
MTCDHCGDRDAVIHFTEIQNNEVTQSHLCEECAAEKGLTPESGQLDFPLTDFLAQMNASTEPEADERRRSCAYCGMDLAEFKKVGRLGCSHCYPTFERHLRTLLRRLHGGTQHVGKVYLPPDPSAAELERRLMGLRRRLARAVDSEDFERAAKLRDQIRSLETTA